MRKFWYLLIFGAPVVGSVVMGVLWLRAEMRNALPTYSDPEVIASNELYGDLCENKMGVTIHRQVAGVDGYLRHPNTSYFDGEDSEPTGASRGGCTSVCLQQMLEQSFKYVEAPYDASGSYIFFNELATATGKFRYHLIDRPDARCTRFDRLMQQNGAYKDRLAPFADLLSRQCIIATPVEEFSALYEMYIETLRRANPEYLGTTGFIDELRRSVLVRQTGEVLAVQRSYMAGNPNFRNKIASFCRVPSSDWLEIGHVLTGVQQTSDSEN